MAATVSTSDLPAETLGMGNPSGEYRPATRHSVLSGVAFLVFAAGAFAVAVLAGDTMILIILGLFGLLFLVGAVYQFVQGAANRNLRIVVLDQGLVRSTGDKADIMRWDDVMSVYQAITDHYRNGVKTGTSHIYTVHLQNGRKIVYNDVIKNVQALGETIQKEATARLLPKASQVLVSGGMQTFGSLTVSREGLGTGKEIVPWAQIDSVKLNAGRITVMRQGKPVAGGSQTVAQTPNLFVFLALVERMKGARLAP